MQAVLGAVPQFVRDVHPVDPAQEIQFRNAQRIFAHKELVRSAEEFKRLSRVAALARRKAVLDDPNAELSEDSQALLQNALTVAYVEKYYPDQLSRSPEEWAEAGKFVFGQINSHLQNELTEGPLTSEELDALAQFTLTRKLYVADERTMGLALAILRFEGLIRNNASAEVEETPLPEPELEVIPDPDAEIAPYIEKNPYREGTRQFAEFDRASKIEARRKFDRIAARDGALQELSPLYRNAVARIAEATGNEVPATCMRELFAAISASRQPFSEATIRKTFLKMYFNQMSDAQREAAFTADELRDYAMNNSTLSADAFAFAVGGGNRFGSSGAPVRNL
jgi:hypothetical protein